MSNPNQDNNPESYYCALVDGPLKHDGGKGPDQWALRCIILHPGRQSDAIECTILHSTLGEVQGRYEALSYTWGDSTDKQVIFVNKRPFLATRNLEAALLRLRRESRERLLWVDSICINQTDVGEVNTQVHRMWAIYERARQVVVFLGPEADDSDKALRLLSVLSLITVNHGVSDIYKLLSKGEMAISWDALLCLMRRGWWTRAWIIQEYAVARTVTFVCGSVELDGEEFGRALENLVEYRFSGLVSKQHEYLIRHVASTPIHHLWSTRCAYRASGSGSRPDAMDILYRFRGSKSFDPRDKIYSLYRLIAENKRLAPDYTKPVKELFIDVVGAMIESTGTLHVLCHHNRSISGLKGLPTWCPDWTVMRGKRILLWPNQYQAAGDPSLPAFAHIDDGLLTLKGRTVDRIRCLKKFESDDFKNMGNMYNDILDLQSAALSNVDERSHTQVLDAFRRTLVASRIRERGPQNDATVLGPGAADDMWNEWVHKMEGRPCEEKMSTWYNEAIYSALYGRAFFISQHGRFGLVDNSAQSGDVIGVFQGAQVPFAMHEMPSTRPRLEMEPVRYEFVGEW